MKKKPERSIQPAPIVALVCIVLALFLVGGLNVPGVSTTDFYKEGIAEVGFTGLLFYWLYTNRSIRNITFTFSATRLFFAGLLLWATASVFWATNIDFFLSKYLLWLGTAAIFLLTLTLSPSTRAHIILARGLVFATTYISIIGLAQVFYALEIYSQAVPPATTFANKNVATQVVVLIFPLACFLLCVDKNKYLSRLYPFILVLMLTYVFHTNTRAAWLSIALEVLLIALSIIIFWCFIWDRKTLKAGLSKVGHVVCGRNSRSDMLLNIGFIIVAIALMLFLINVSAQGWSSFGDVFTAKMADLVQSFESRGQPVYEAQRYQIWDAALTMIATNPLVGTGMGSFFSNLLSQSEKYRAYSEIRAHNDVLELGVELGVIGWILLSGALIGLLLNLYKLITQSEIQHRLFFLSIAIALAGSALNMQFSFPYQMPVPLVLFGLYAALIVKAGDCYHTKIKTIELSLKPFHWNIGLGFVGLIVVFVLVMNFIWLSTVSRMTDNMKNYGWKNPIAENTLACHKTIVKTIHDIASAYSDMQEYESSLSTLDSFAQCMPNTWLYESTKGVSLIGLGRYHEAIKVLDQAKQHSPEGEHTAYTNQFVAYNQINDRPAMLRAYQQLSAQPEALLTLQPKVLRILTEVGLQLQQPEQAERFYRLYRQYYGHNAKFEALVGTSFKNK